jgi:GMP synthase-like glutamine amidotransferase
MEVSLTGEAAADPVFGDAPARFNTLQWHGDTYELPAGATRLARSALYEQQAFVMGAAYGLQFHLEVTSELAAEWMAIDDYARELETLAGPGTPQRLEDEVRAEEHASVPLARSLFGRWLERVVGYPAL